MKVCHTHKFRGIISSERIVRMEIFTFGAGGRTEYCKEYLKELSFAKRLVLLPIPTTLDKTLIKGTEIPLSEIYSICDEGTVVFGYGFPEQAAETVKERGARLFDGSKDEELVSDNAALTAEGALGIILTESDSSIVDKRIGIIGYGRIGSRLFKLLMLMGARVKLYTRSVSLREEFGKEGVETEEFSSDSDYSGLDLLVNTAPTVIMDEKKLSFYEEKGLLIYDLASGKCFPDSPSVKKLPSLPERMYPRSAGKVYSDFVLRKIREAHG